MIICYQYNIFHIQIVTLFECVAGVSGVVKRLPDGNAIINVPSATITLDCIQAYLSID